MNCDFKNLKKISKKFVLITVIASLCLCQLGISVFAGSGGGGSVLLSVTGNIANTPVTNTGSSTSVNMKHDVQVIDGKSSVIVGNAVGTVFVNNAVNNKSSEVVVQATTASGGAESSSIKLPESAIKDLSSKTDAGVTVNADNATISFDNAAVDAIAAQSGDYGKISLSIDTVENKKNKLTLELTLETTKGSVSDFNGGNVTVTVPVREVYGDKKLVCVYINTDGQYTRMKGKMNDDGTFTFSTSHFSTYSIIPEDEADIVIADQNIKVGTPSVKLYAYKGGKLTVKASARNAAGYKVSYKKSSAKSWKNVSVNSKSLNKTFKKLAKGKYTVKVTAFRKTLTGNVSWGAASKAKSITIKK